MGLFDNWPYTNFHELNLSWLLKEMLELNKKVDDFVNLNTIKYADPIQWNITKQYETNTVVIDGNTGTAYISTKPVPSGVALTNTDYWTVIFTLDILSANQNITFRNDAANVLATFGSAVGDWILWNSELYKVIRAINVNEAYVVGYNLERITVELFIREYITNIKNIIGNLSDLTTSDNDSIVDAINSIITERGDLSDLDTTDKTSIVNAINEVSDAVDALNPQQVVFPEWFGAVGDGVTDDTTAIQNAINHGDVVVLNNQYYVTDTINVSKGKAIKGTGIIKTDVRHDVFNLMGNNIVNGLTFTDTLPYDATGGSCIYSIDKDNITILNCKFNTIGAGNCILLEHCNHIVVENNKLTNYGFSGIMLKGTCRYASIQFNKLYNSRYMGSQHSYPICFSAYQLTEDGPAEYVKVNYNEIIEVSPHWEGIDSHGAKDYEVIGNRIIGTLSGMNLGSTPTSITVDYENANHNCIIKDNYIDCGSADISEVPYGIQLSEQPNCRAQNAIIENNYIKVNSSNEATTAVCSAISIRGNGGSRNCIINNNIFEVTNRHCIAIDYGKHENLVIKNNYAKTMTTTNNWYYFFNMNLVDDYDNIEIINNRMRNAFAGNIGFFNGTTAAPTDNKLIEFKGNDDKGLTSSRINYTTLPDSVLLPITKAKGVAGQFKPSTSATVAGWLCHGANNWVKIAGTSV